MIGIGAWARAPRSVPLARTSSNEPSFQSSTNIRISSVVHPGSEDRASTICPATTSIVARRCAHASSSCPDFRPCSSIISSVGTLSSDSVPANRGWSSSVPWVESTRCASSGIAIGWVDRVANRGSRSRRAGSCAGAVCRPSISAANVDGSWVTASSNRIPTPASVCSRAALASSIRYTTTPAITTGERPSRTITSSTGVETHSRAAPHTRAPNRDRFWITVGCTWPAARSSADRFSSTRRSCRRFSAPSGASAQPLTAARSPAGAATAARAR